MNTFEAQILTPEGTLFEGEATGVRVPGSQGSFEVKALHADIISSLETGEILIRRAEGGEFRLAVSGGFVEVHDNTLTLLAEAAEPVEEIDLERARAALKRAKERLQAEDASIDQERARQARERAENRIKLSVDVTVSTPER